MAREDITARVTGILEEYLADKNLEVYRVTYKKEGPGWVLRAAIDKTENADNEYVSIEDCEEVTGFLSSKLDELDLIDRSYSLEVCSAGLDRELIRDRDYVRFAGRAVEVKTYEQISGSKFHEGTLISKEDGIVRIDTAGGVISIPEDKISKINLAVIF